MNCCDTCCITIMCLTCLTAVLDVFFFSVGPLFFCTSSCPKSMGLDLNDYNTLIKTSDLWLSAMQQWGKQTQERPQRMQRLSQIGGPWQGRMGRWMISIDFRCYHMFMFFFLTYYLFSWWMMHMCRWFFALSFLTWHLQHAMPYVGEFCLANQCPVSGQ